MKVFKKLAVLALVLTMIAGLFPARGAQAATKPGKPGITVKANDDGKSATLTIAKTKNAQGYKIMVKKPGASKFTKLTTLKKDGTAARTYTAKKLASGEYQFKVRAYLKNGSKTVWGKYSKVVKVTVGKSEEDDKKDDKDTGKSGDPDKTIGYGTATKLDLSKLCGTYTDEAGGTFRIEAVDGGYQVVDVDHLANSYLVSHLRYGGDYNFSNLPLYDGLTEYLDKGSEGMISLPTFTEADFKFVEPDYILYPDEKPHYEISKQAALSDTLSAYVSLTIGTDSVSYWNTVTVYGEYKITKAFGMYYCQATQRK